MSELNSIVGHPVGVQRVGELVGVRKTHPFEEFPGGLVVRICHCHCCGPGSIPGQGTETLKATWHGQNKNKKQTENPRTFGVRSAVSKKQIIVPSKAILGPSLSCSGPRSSWHMDHTVQTPCPLASG